MIVMKFGGTSVKDAEALDRVVSIIASRQDEKPVVVVSALGKTTDTLVALLDAIALGRPGEARMLASDITHHHKEVIGKVLPAGPDRDRAMEILSQALTRLGRLIDGMECLGEVSPRSRDAVLATGELAAAPLLAIFLASRGLPAEPLDPMRIIVTDQSHESAAPDMAETGSRCREAIEPLLRAGRIPVVGGFVGATRQGVTTTLGRGGSDLTASLVARSLEAAALEYWKDVDGILTADPRIVPDARPVPSLTFREAAELAFLGAKVLHPASIQPAVDAGVPVRVRNSFRPESPGTVITAAPATAGTPLSPEQAISSVACKRNQVLVNVYSTRMIGASGFLRKVFEVFDRLGLSVDHIATSEVNVTVTMSPTERLEELKRELGEVAKVDVEPGVGIVSLVGERLTTTPGVGARIFGALKDINIKLVTYGGSGVNLSLVVRDEEVPEAVRSLHQELCVRAAGREGSA